MANCSYCNARITPNQEKTSIALFMKPVCSKTECEKKARVVGDAVVDSLMTPQDQIRALLARRDFKEQSIKGFYLFDTGSTKIAVNLNQMSGIPGTPCPQVGVLQTNGDITEEGHGIGRIDDIRQELESILKSKSKNTEAKNKEMPAPVEEKHEEKHKETETRKDAKIKECGTRPEKPEVIVPGNIIAILDKHGWRIEDNTALKIVDSHEVKIDLSKLDQRGKSTKVDGYSYGFGQNNIIDTELKSLFGEITNVQNPKERNKMETKPDDVKKERIPPAKPPENALVKIFDLELNTETVLKYLCPDATLEEAVMFLQVCKIKNLNPFIPGEIFLVKYDKTQSASIVVGKYAFTKKADQHPDFRGYQAGIIILTTEGKIEEREGTFYLPKGRNTKEGDVFETLLGGWARVKRTNREDIVIKVALQECIQFKKDGQPNRFWASQPATMISKNALVRALRDAFPGELGGLYDQSEIQDVT